ncbi:MAG: YggS family pyridoxal phosphate-dependent enzyme [Acholeplasmataceae bacterium]|nr:YggS family pyridoxal phosphate-dependent enzyme [Acholeplasmataceae bacterium]
MIENFQGTIVCASKYFDGAQLRSIYEQGFHDFGENRTHVLLERKKELDDLSVIWHFIGHLQSNKVKTIINELDYLHTLDRLSLAKTIQKYRETPLKCFIQVNLTEESQKSGVDPNNLPDFLFELKKYDKIEVIGFMTMGKLDDKVVTERAFKQLKALQDTYQLPSLSMGMTDDYELAIQYGTTHLRIGRKFYELLK